MRIANIISPGAEYMLPEGGVLADGTKVENVITKVNVPLSTDPLRLMLRDLVYTEAAIRAETDGFDAVFINTVADYGLEQVRAAIGVPSIGAGEAGVRAAGRLGAKYSIVTVWPSSTQLYYDRLIHATGTEQDCVSVRYVIEEDELTPLGGGVAVIEMVKDSASDMAARILRSAKAAVEQDGAEAIILGCTCMSKLTPFLAENLPVPVIDPLAEGYLATAEAARLGDASPYQGTRATEDSIERVNSAIAVWEGLGDSGRAGWGAVDDCEDACAVVAVA